MELKPLLTRLTTAAFLLGLITLNSCKKENSDSLTPAEQEQASVASTEADAESDYVYDDVFNNVMGVNDDVGMAGVGEISGRTTATGYVGDGTTGREFRLDSGIHCYTVTITHLSTSNFFPVRIVTDLARQAAWVVMDMYAMVK
jgi:hypothetical protein